MPGRSKEFPNDRQGEQLHELGGRGMAGSMSTRCLHGLGPWQDEVRRDGLCRIRTPEL